MWPLLLDMTKDESIQSLRNLELEAYSHLVSALRAQGPLNSNKRKLLKETSNALNITQERHKAEVRRALSDEKLSTIAYHVNGQNEYLDDWAQEGRRNTPLMPRMAPQTTLSVIADEIADNAEQNNKQLPLPSNTERKRSSNVQPNQNLSGDASKINSFRVPDTPKNEENKKRKFSESSSLAQHLLGPTKISKIQQIYRQKTKSKTKEQFIRIKTELDHHELIQNRVQHPMVLQKPPQTMKVPMNAPMATVSSNGSKINLLQNINLQQPHSLLEDQNKDFNDVNNYVLQKFNEQNHIPSQPANISENLTNRLKLLTKSNNNIMFKPMATQPITSLNTEPQKTLKVCPTRKTITKTVPSTGQKLIVVSNAQTIPSTSILQRTLTIPFVKNISVKNFDKFKIVTTTNTPMTLATSVVTTNTFNSVKHKVVTVRTGNAASAGRKVFPLTHLQMLNKGNIKVLPLGGKILGKTSTSTTPSSMYFMNTSENIQNLTKSINNLPVVTASKASENVESTEIIVQPSMENLDSPKNIEKLDEDLKNSPVIFERDHPSTEGEDYDAKIDEFHIQTVSMDSQDTIVEVQCENDFKVEEDLQGIEIARNQIIDLPEIDCFVSEADVIETSEKVLDFEHSPIISCEESEMEVEEYIIDDKHAVLAEAQLDLSDMKHNITDLGYVEN